MLAIAATTRRTNNPLERILREIRRRTRVVGSFPDGQSALNLAAARLRHIAGTAWSTKRYLNIELLKDQQMRGAITAWASAGRRSAQTKCAKNSGHYHYKFRVFTAGQKRRVTPQIKREFKRRAAIEPVIGHLKTEHRMGRNHLAHRAGDATNAVLAAVGYNFHLLPRWLTFLLCKILLAFAASSQFNPAEIPVLHGRRSHRAAGINH